ncbi:sigma-54 interaction domain-containing protein [Aminipila luticellarii]|uniref:HTH-type transcriptional regulatory protein TyrR n=1 Tax=Aminipila luticellarii TaxID=2507160 RepID=A0A410PXQ6_9FIRM|nr:sigma 54-interacting transcriptional regulator [Aminipila luticellarii]QAT43655.1 PAS domain S-box protein [Aminipila luticellarii]
MSQELNILNLCESCAAALRHAMDSDFPKELHRSLQQRLFLLETALDQFKQNHIDFEEICNHLIDAIYVSDKNGKTIYVNQAYLDFSGLKKEDFVGKSVYEINQEKKLYTNGVIPAVLSTKERKEAVGTVISSNQKIFITGIPIFDDQGELKYAVAHDKDIDQLEKLKDALALLKSQQASSNAELEYLRKRQLDNLNLVANSPNFKEAIQTAQTIASTDVTVLITGESGTGKEIIADFIYKSSNRTSKPFLKINCSAIPANLLESELFGYAEGSFTGALKGGKPGLFEIANGGTILLDEIGDMSLDLQTKLLRVLQEKEVFRIGSSKVIPLDVRILAATNRDLKKAIAEGNFREDLYYRLNVVPIYLAPLKERKEDIGDLVHKFLEKYNKKYVKLASLTPDAVSALHEYSWPGNIRELKNIMERMVVINGTGEINASTVKQVLGISPVVPLSSPSPDALPSYGQIIEGNLKKSVESFETDMIRRAIAQYGSKRKAASALGVDHSTLIKKCQRYGI